VRRYEEEFPNIRPSFSRDGDRILHSAAFTRYIDKTQVFSLSENDLITHRVIHVQLVSKISRIIARALRLNEDLVEAIALGHDIGHTPFGHDGEDHLNNEVTQKLGVESFYFRHGVQSVRALDKLEGRHIPGTVGRSLNLTLQVLDGILCHDGEDLRRSIGPERDKSWKDFDYEMERKKKEKKVEIAPMTLEGCLVRFVDTIAFLGRDIEDAITIGLIKWDEFPKILGDSNREIVNNLAMDIIEQSRGGDEISYSPKRFDQLKKLRDFNYRRIYNNPLIKIQKDKIRGMFDALYRRFLRDVKDERTDSPIFLDHINLIDRGDEERSYFRNTPCEIIVIDYMAGMTDDYFINIFTELFTPRKLPLNFRQIERATGLPKKRLIQLYEEEKVRT
jgi:dGTPase